MDSICQDVKDDINNIEEDTKKINCSAIVDLIKHIIKFCIDSLRCCLKFKVE